LKPSVRQTLEQFTYEASQDQAWEERFGPVTPGTVSLPERVEVKFIADDDGCEELKNLVGKPVIGLDCEWRPNLTKFIKTDTAILQISDETTCYIIDLIALKGSQKLDRVLKAVFMDESTLKLGLALRGDLTRIQNTFGEAVSFAEKMVRYLDLGLLHQDLMEFKEKP